MRPFLAGMPRGWVHVLKQCTRCSALAWLGYRYRSFVESLKTRVTPLSRVIPTQRRHWVTFKIQRWTTGWRVETLRAGSQERRSDHLVTASASTAVDL